MASRSHTVIWAINNQVLTLWSFSVDYVFSSSGKVKLIFSGKPNMNKSFIRTSVDYKGKKACKCKYVNWSVWAEKVDLYPKCVFVGKRSQGSSETPSTIAVPWAMFYRWGRTSIREPMLINGKWSHGPFEVQGGGLQCGSAVWALGGSACLRTVTGAKFIWFEELLVVGNIFCLNVVCSRHLKN